MAVKKGELKSDEVRVLLLGLIDSPTDIQDLHIRLKGNGKYRVILRTTAESDEEFEKFKADKKAGDK